MSTPLNRLSEAVLMCTHNLCFKNKKNNKNFHLKIIIITVVKYYSILYGRVIVMPSSGQLHDRPGSTTCCCGCLGPRIDVKVVARAPVVNFQVSFE